MGNVFSAIGSAAKSTGSFIISTAKSTGSFIKSTAIKVWESPITKVAAAVAIGTAVGLATAAAAPVVAGVAGITLSTKATIIASVAVGNVVTGGFLYLFTKDCSYPQPDTNKPATPPKGNQPPPFEGKPPAAGPPPMDYIRKNGDISKWNCSCVHPSEVKAIGDSSLWREVPKETISKLVSIDIKFRVALLKAEERVESCSPEEATKQVKWELMEETVLGFSDAQWSEKPGTPLRGKSPAQVHQPSHLSLLS